jgi:phage replication O-like protein O
MCRTEIRPPSAAQVLLAIIRKTYGWNKKEDGIPLTQIMNITGLSRRSVIYALQELEAKAMITVTRYRDERNINSVNVIRLNKDYETWKPEKSSPQLEEKRKNDRLKLSTKRGGARHQPSARHASNLVHDIAQKDECRAPSKDKDNSKDSRPPVENFKNQKGKRPYLEGDQAWQDPESKQWRVKIHTGEWVDYVGRAKPEWR